MGEHNLVDGASVQTGDGGRARKMRVPAFLNVPWTVRDLVLFVVAWIGLQVVIILLLKAAGVYVPGIAEFLQGAQTGEIVPSFLMNLLDAGVALGVISLYLQKYNVGWSSLGWRRVGLLKTIAYLVGVLVVFTIAANVLLELVKVLLPGFDPNQAQNNEFTGEAGKAHPNLVLVALVLLPPILEETIFRGFLFPAISKRTGIFWGAVISSIVFGMAHGQANIAVYTFVIGLVLCFMYVRTRSIVPGILLHMLNNYLALLAR